jgi:hypothetical protein
MKRAIKAAAASMCLAASVVLAWAGPASAHEQRQVGAYQLTVGWAHEPTYTGVENAVQIFVKNAKGDPVDDLGDPPTLKVQVQAGSQTSDPLELKPSFDEDTGLGTHGEFDAAIIPTSPGDYTFHLTGDIAGQKVDEKFTSSEKTFDSVKDPTEVEFPAKPPSAAAVSANLDRLNPRVDAATTRAASAKKNADSAKTLAIVALAVGVVLGLAGLAAGLAARRRT